MIEIQNIVTSCAPWEPNDEDYAEQQDYLISLLSSRRDEYEKEAAFATASAVDEELLEIVDEFFADPEASRKLVDLWKASFTATSEKRKALTNTTASSPSNGAASLGHCLEADTSETTATRALSETKKPTNVEPAMNTTNEATPAVVVSKSNRKTRNSRSPKRERRRQKKKESKNRRSNADGEGQSLHQAVEQIHEASALELDAADDFSSAWQDAQETGRVWGGRGFGGRGVNRGLGTYRGKDAVVQGLTMAFDGKELLRETHLVIAHGHRYGLWGKNGVGKSTLLRRIAGGRVPGWPLHLSVAMVEQEVLGSDKTVKECIMHAGANKNKSNSKGSDPKQNLEEELTQLETQLVELTDADGETAEALEEITMRLSELYEALEEIEGNEQEQSSDSESSSSSRSSNESEEKDAFEGLDKSSIEILRGLSFEASMMDIPVKELSGGWRMKVALAEALCSHPDIFLLDEPTNHLDASATIFLEDYILKHDLTLVVVSHDGDFLDAICTDMIKFENQTLEYHVGNYSTFLDRQEQLWKTNTHIAEAVAKKEQKAMEFINKQKSMSKNKRRDDNKQRQAKEREKKLSRIGLYNTNGKRFKLLSERKGVNAASHINGAYTNSAGFTSFHVDNSQKSFGEEKQRLRFKFPSASPLKGATGDFAPLITLDDCRFRYGSDNTVADGTSKDDSSSWLLRDMTLGVSVGSRIGILGKNGSGKSTLVKLLCGELSPDPKQGSLWRHPNLKIAHISQHHIEHLGAHLGESSVEYFRNQHGSGGAGVSSDHQIRQFLGGFGLVGSLALQPIGSLSGGQKARLAFATVLYQAPHVLILDEPTNHLDRESLESLAGAVSGFGGAVVTVSHHRGFLAQTCREVWTIQKDGRVVTEVVESEAKTNDNESSSVQNGGGTPFDVLYENYKNSLRKEVLLRGKKKEKQQQRCRRKQR